MFHQEVEGGRTLRHLHVSGILFELPSGKIMCIDHEVGPVFGVYGTFATVFAFPYEIKQPLESIDSQCVRMQSTQSSKNSKTFISWVRWSTCWPDLTPTFSVRRVGYLPAILSSHYETQFFLLCLYLKAIYFYCCPHLKYFRLMKQYDCFYLQSTSFLLMNVIHKNSNLNPSGYLC